MSRKSVTIPLTFVTDPNLSTAAKVIYAVLKSFKSGKSGSLVAPSIIASHKEIIDRSNLSQKTVVKGLNKLESAGWIARQRTEGLPNRYIFTTPLTQFDGDNERIKQRRLVLGKRRTILQKSSSIVVVSEESPGKIIGEFIIGVILVHQLDELRKVRSG